LKASILDQPAGDHITSFVVFVLACKYAADVTPPLAGWFFHGFCRVSLSSGADPDPATFLTIAKM